MKIAIPKVNIYLDWYLHQRGKEQLISATEKIIQKTLTKLGKVFYREVSFKGFGHPFSPYRFDFYLPKEKLVIEYDGPYHKIKIQKERDKIKDKFCAINGIRIVRFNICHYKSLEFYVKKLLTP